MMTNEHLAKEAQRLLGDETLIQAIADAQRDAMSGLVTVDAANTIEVQRLQAIVQAYDGLLSQLQIYVLRQTQPEMEGEQA